MIHPARYHSLGELLQDAFLQYPSDTAAIEVDRDRELARLTYAEVRQAVRRVAGWLTTQGLHDGARVGIVMSNQSSWLIAAAAVLHVGSVIVPLDSRATGAEQSILLRHAKVDGLFADAHLLRALDTTARVVVVTGAREEHPRATRMEDVLAHDGEVDLTPRTRDALAAIVYSSGTGGDPKGCLLTHGNYLAQYQSLMETFEWRRGDVYFSILPTNHAIDFMCGFLASWATGATVLHQRTLRPEVLVKTMRRFRVTTMSVVPMILRALQRAVQDKLDDAPEGRRKAVDALTTLNAWITQRAPNHRVSRLLLKPVHDAFGGHLRMIFCGGAFTDRALAEFFTDLGIPVVIGYGLTEACTVATVNDLKPFRGDTVGRAVPGVDVRIVNAGPDGVGEVQIAGPTVFAGYLDDPDQTHDAFDGAWLKTGDLGWLDAAHHLHLVGRRKNMIVTPGGKNVYPEDVESAFEKVDVDELCVLAEDYVWPRTGLVGERLVAVVRVHDDRRAAARKALAQHNRALPEHKRVGGVLWLDDTFPRTASMKLKRADLASRVRDAHPRDAVEDLA